MSRLSRSYREARLFVTSRMAEDSLLNTLLACFTQIDCQSTEDMSSVIWATSSIFPCEVTRDMSGTSSKDNSSNARCNRSSGGT